MSLPEKSHFGTEWNSQPDEELYIDLVGGILLMHAMRDQGMWNFMPNFNIYLIYLALRRLLYRPHEMQ